MATEDELGLEEEEKVLTPRLDAFEPLAVKLLRDAQRSRTWMNGLDRDDVTHEWSQRSRDRADSISLGHRLGQAG